MSTFYDFDPDRLGVALLPADPGWDGGGSGAEEPGLRRALRTVAARLGLAYSDMYDLAAAAELEQYEVSYYDRSGPQPGVLYWSGNWAYADSGQLRLSLSPEQLADVLAQLARGRPRGHRRR